MYRNSYAEVLEDTFEDAREREREALERSIDLLKAAEAKGRQSREAIDALFHTRRLWSVLLEDLANSDNDLPETLRASLISVGIWIMRETELIRLEKSENFRGIIEISQIIHEGLK